MLNSLGFGPLIQPMTMVRRRERGSEQRSTVMIGTFIAAPTLRISYVPAVR